MGETITVKIRPSTGILFDVEFDPDCTVFQLKEKVGDKMAGTSAKLLKLVYSGRILKDEDTCSSYKLANGHTLHVVKSKTPSATATSSPSSSSSPAAKTTIATTPPPSSTVPTGNNNATPTTQSSQTTNRATPFSSAASPFPGMGDGMPQMNPEAMRQMMDNPFMQGLLNNTDFVRSIIMSNPQMRTLVEENPEIGHAINNPDFLRQSIEMMRNPELMREAQRSNDRALSNIEALPGGFNHLRRMYSTIQDPLESATRPIDTLSDEANERLARQLNVTSVQENTLNTQALPNPWAAPTNNNNNNNNANNTNSSSTNTSASANPFAALMGGSGSGSTPFAFPFMGPPNPINPTSSDSSPSATGDQQQRSGSNLPFWADPNLAAQLQQSMMMGQQSNNGFSDMPFMPNFWGGLNNNNNNSTTSDSTTPVESPEIRFQAQLDQLEDMGFFEKQANIRALLATGGNIEAAVEYLLNN
ncbi:hypothetical protein BC941DRAFT_415412 [Chlamydoabsidia padenii]|nr:hypothetical protein BC941DRAFT_415412 [Chlamydoabsidia padenii]